MASQSNSNSNSNTNARELHEICERFVSKALDTNMWLQHLISTMDRSGCEVTRDFFKCMPCAKPAEGFFHSKLGVVLCENHVKTPRRLEETMLHESLHAFDLCRNDVDYDDCTQVACMEIRAANLSGQCKWSNEITRGNTLFRRQHQRCVERRAELSLQQLPHCKDKAKRSVTRAWESCFNDKDPFGHIP